MKITVAFILAVVLFCQLVASKDTGRHEVDTEKRSLLRGERGLFKCKKLSKSCHGTIFDSCCDDLVCYREEKLYPHTAFTEGVCVVCIGRGQNCQKDEQCCHSLTCIREGKFDFTGQCLEKRQYNDPCTEDDDCESDHCHKDDRWETRRCAKYPRHDHHHDHDDD